MEIEFINENKRMFRSELEWWIETCLLYKKEKEKRKKIREKLISTTHIQED